MKIFELFEEVSQKDLSDVERFATNLWGRLGVDVRFSYHFIGRVNDPRNRKPITVGELIRLFRKEYEEYGKVIAHSDGEAVLKDALTSLNLPFVIKDENQGPDDKTMVAKTIMRKPNFQTSNHEYIVR
jgi:hypothetical protein